MEVKLIMTGGKTPAQEVEVTGPRFFVGRADDCQLRPRSDLISRHHCVILTEDDFVSVRDFGSKNGTFVNGERITSEAELHSGDTLKIGPIEFEIRIGAGASGKPRPAPARRQPVPKEIEVPAAEMSTAEIAAPGRETTTKESPPPAKGAGGKKKPKVKSVQEAAARTVASAGSKDDEDDVSAWLDEDVAAPMGDTAAMEPTRAVQSPKSTELPAPEPAASEPVDEEPVEAEEEEEEPEDPKTKPDAFHIPTGHRGPVTGGSKDSASNALKKFFHRR